MDELHGVQDLNAFIVSRLALHLGSQMSSGPEKSEEKAREQPEESSRGCELGYTLKRKDVQQIL